MDTTEATNKADTSVPVEPLKSKRKTGEPYQRLEVVDTQIIKLNGMPESERAAEFRHSRPEVIFHFIRNGGRKDPAMYQLLCVELARRIAARVRQHTRGFPERVVEEIAMNVDSAIMKVALSGQPERQADFLEIHFYGVLEGRVLDALRTWNCSVMGGRRVWIRTNETDEEGDVIECTIELLPGNEPGPQENLLTSEDKGLVQRAIEAARAQVPDPRHLEAVILHYFEGWPVTSRDPEIASLVTYFRVSERTIWDWFSRTLKILHRILMALKTGEVQ